MDNNISWLAECFGDYDLLHLDPLLLDLVEQEAKPGPGHLLWNQTKEAMSGLSFWKKIEEAAPGFMFQESAEEAEPDPYPGDLLAATGLSPGSRSQMEFFDSGGLLDRLRSDHELRRKIVLQVERAPDALAGPTSLSDVASAAVVATGDNRKDDASTAIVEPDDDHKDDASAAVVETGADDKEAAGARQPTSVIVVEETILNKIARLPPEMAKALEIPYLDDGRRLGYVLSDRPFRLLSLDRPAVPLVVNGEAADRWTAEVEQFLAAGWYPYVLVLGRYRVAGGRPYIDALAVLAKRYPPIHQILLPREGSPSGHSLTEMLQGTADRIEEVAALIEDRKGSSQDIALSQTAAGEEGESKVKSPPAAKDGAREAHPDPVYHQLLQPLLMFGLCCEVNGVDLALLKSRAQPVYNTYQACVSKLVKKGSKWDQEGQENPLVDTVRQGRGRTLPIFTENDAPPQYAVSTVRSR